MWTRKSELEIIESDRKIKLRKYNPLQSIIIGLVAVVFILINNGLHKSPSVYFYLATFLICSFVAYIARIFFKRTFLVSLTGEIFNYKNENTGICINCKKIQEFKSKCDNCGGVLERTNHWKWIDL